MNHMTKIRVVLLVLAVLTFGGCGKKPVIQTPVEIDISGCVAPAWTDVPDGGTVFWKSTDGVNYNITFPGKDPISPPIVSGPTYPAHGGFWCTNTGIGCKYKYSLTKNGASAACADPGIRIIPQ